MKQAPKSVIHINFIAGELLFDARPVWAALRRAVESGKVSKMLGDQLSKEFGETALHLGMRHYVMKTAVKELKSALGDVYKLVPEPWSVPDVNGYRVIHGKASESARDKVLLAIDSFLFEFRAYLDLLARFVHGFLTGIGKGPRQKEQLSTGKYVQIVGKNGKLRPHAFLLYLCDRCAVSVDWYEFLSGHRNFFTHEGAPYCAIEDRMVRPPEFDLLVMKSNIHDFRKADASAYFRVSECQAVVGGLAKLGSAAQKYVVDALHE
jgi:hypothetical protein